MCLKCKPTFGDFNLEQLWPSRSHCHSRKTGRSLSLQCHGGIYRICGRVKRLEAILLEIVSIMSGTLILN